LTDWLRGAAPDALTQALLAWPHPAPLPKLLQLARELPKLRDENL